MIKLASSCDKLHVISYTCNLRQCRPNSDHHDHHQTCEHSKGENLKHASEKGVSPSAKVITFFTRGSLLPLGVGMIGFQ